MSSRFALATSLAVLLFAAPAMASTMPRADFGNRPTLGLGLGWGVGASLDVPLSGLASLGAGVSFTRFNTGGANVRFLYKLIHGGGGLTLDLLVGGDVGYVFAGGSTAFGPFAGVALAYPFTRQLTGRLNLAVNPLAFGSPDASGIELGYKFSPTMEGTIGGNGRGDFLGLKMYI
jgi:hypothetical protein